MPDHDYLYGTIRRKYEIRKADGRPVDPDAEYFVLRLDRDHLGEPRDPHAHEAVRAYARSIESVNREFARDLEYWLEMGLHTGFSDRFLEDAGFTRRIRPKIVCLCGSSRWPKPHFEAMMTLTLQGAIVVPMGMYGHADFPPGARGLTDDGDPQSGVKHFLDDLHKRKIDLADEIMVVTVDGYIGESTLDEIAYANETGKAVVYHRVTSDQAGRPIEIKPRKMP